MATVAPFTYPSRFITLHFDLLTAPPLCPVLPGSAVSDARSVASRSADR